MSKAKTFALVLLGACIHFALTGWAVVTRLSCGEVPHCVSPVITVASNALALPLGLITWFLDYVGINVARIFGSWLMLFFFLNSVLAVSLIWYAIIKPFVSRVRKVRA